MTKREVNKKIGSDSIFLIGGYGHVGAFLARELAMLYPGRIILAGRRLAAAQDLARTLPGNVSSVEINSEDKQSVLSVVRAYPDAVLLRNEVANFSECRQFRKKVLEISKG